MVENKLVEWLRKRGWMFWVGVMVCLCVGVCYDDYRRGRNTKVSEIMEKFPAGELAGVISEGGEIQIVVCDGYFSECEDVFKSLVTLGRRDLGVAPRVKTLYAEREGEESSVKASWALRVEDYDYRLVLLFLQTPIQGSYLSRGKVEILFIRDE